MRNSTITPRVGIILVSYNSAEAVRLTLASIVTAKTNTEYNIALIDNASSPHELKAIKAAFDSYADGRQGWSFFQSETNLGFAGGNNLGISFFFDEAQITHICLLNTDTIVTDHWLDRLLEKNCHAISPVTNRSDSDQCVPVSYDFELSNAIDKKQNINPHVFAVISEFAQQRYAMFSHERTSGEPTFFCVLFTKELMQKVGLLDPVFFPGGYEDDDYCLRTKACGYELFIARDVFVHHWGSVSFGKLDHDYFQIHAAKNRQYLENKHGVTWRIRPHKALSSYRYDVLSLLQRQEPKARKLVFEKIFRAQLNPLVRSFASEYAAISASVRASALYPPSLEPALHLDSSESGLLALWTALLENIDQCFADDEHCQNILLQLEQRFIRIEELFLSVVEAYHTLNAWLAQNQNVSTIPLGKGKKIKRAIGLLGKGIRCLLHSRGILFFGGYKYPEREKDGYFQRIDAIDEIFSDFLRIYVDFHPRSVHQVKWVSQPKSSTIVFNYTGTKLQKVLIHLCSIILALRFRRIYFHSVLAMWPGKFPLLLRIPGMRGAIDIHGVVPEEFRYHNDFYSAIQTEKLESFAVRYTKIIVVVSEAMGQYLRQKYRKRIKGQIFVLPIFPNIPEMDDNSKEHEEKPTTIYAGGLHKWQLAPEMANAMAKQPDLCIYKVFTPQPEEFKALLPKTLWEHPGFEIGSKSHAELIKIYPQCHFGFILRDDIIVNHVACPTKLVEYIGMGIIPIIKCALIGDFANCGMQYVRQDDFENGILPDQAVRQAMVKNNMAIYKRMTTERYAAINALRSKLNAS